LVSECLVTEIAEIKETLLFGAAMAPAKIKMGNQKILLLLEADGEDHKVLPVLKLQAVVDGEDHKVLPVSHL
jgi:hypothetical protein